MSSNVSCRRSVRSLRFTRSAAIALSALITLATAAGAQAGPTGSIVGTITDAASGLPVDGARVAVAATQLAAPTDPRGRYVIRNVPAGQHEVRITRIGYRPASRTITVSVNDSTSLSLTITPSAVELAAVVTTGTGGAVEKKRIGTSIGTVDMAAVQEQLPAVDIGQALSAKIPGVRSVAVGGGAGAARDLRIRGTASFSLGQRPVVYIDGVRVDTRATEWTSQLNGLACCNFAGGTSTDRLSDMSPEDIDRVEVLKGAAAATLYGSEATNGVIQIFTKRGKGDSRPTWSLVTTFGADRLRENLPTKRYPLFTGPDGTRAQDANDLIQNGFYQSYDLSVQGGGNRSNYFLSGNFTEQEGSIQPNAAKRASLRTNLTFVPTDKWTVEARSMFTRSLINEQQAGNNWTALLGNAMNGDPRKATSKRPFGEAWVPVSDIETMETTADANRWTGGLTTSYAMRQNFTHRLTFGLDAVSEEKGRFFPFAGDFGAAGVTSGQRNLGYRNYRTFTFDYLGQLNFRLPGNIGSDLSFGGQGYWENERFNIANGGTFPGPGVSTVRSGAVTTADEVYAETINLGMLAQNRFSFGEKLFVTVGVRVDGNSAFGENYGFQTYPKADAAWIVSEHGVLPQWVSNLKLRAAIGQAGKTPRAFDKFQTFTSRSVYQGVPGVVPDNPGNDELSPETTTEIEAGFEVGFFSDRLGIDASVYRSTTADAIVNKFNAPSEGFQTARRVNIGEILNRGWEASINYLAISRGQFGWTTNLRVDGNENEVTDLGGVKLTGNDVRLGYPVRGVWARKMTGYAVVDGKPTFSRSDTAVYFGAPLPTFNAGWGNTFRWGALQLYSLFTMEDGAVFSNGDRPYRVRQGGADEYLQFVDPTTNKANFSGDSTLAKWTLLDAIDSRDNIRLREVSLTYRVPERLSAAARLGPTTITLAGQNLMWWDDCNCVDPNMNWAGGDSFTINSGFLAQPSPRQFRFSVRTRF